MTAKSKQERAIRRAGKADDSRLRKNAQRTEKQRTGKTPWTPPKQGS